MPSFPNTLMTQDIPPGGPADLAFVTSTPLTVSGGSGTYVSIRELARCLADRRVRIATYAPSFWSPSFTATRAMASSGMYLSVSGVPAGTVAR